MARRIWQWTEAVPTERAGRDRAADPPLQDRSAREWLLTGWRRCLSTALARRPSGVQVKLLPQTASSMSSPKAPTGLQGTCDAPSPSEWLWDAQALAGMNLSREELLMRLGAAASKPGRLGGFFSLIASMS